MIQRAQGICFAVASNTAVFAVSEFIAHGRVRRAHIGIAAETVPLPRRIGLATGAGARAIRVSEVEPGGPAAAAGVLAGDLLLSLDGMRDRGRRRADPPAQRRADRQGDRAHVAARRLSSIGRWCRWSGRRGDFFPVPASGKGKRPCHQGRWGHEPQFGGP